MLINDPRHRVLKSHRSKVGATSPGKKKTVTDKKGKKRAVAYMQ